jgi:hypothetical protein
VYFNVVRASRQVFKESDTIPRLKRLNKFAFVCWLTVVVCSKCKGDLEGNGVDLSVACVMQVCSVTTESTFLCRHLNSVCPVRCVL